MALTMYQKYKEGSVFTSESFSEYGNHENYLLDLLNAFKIKCFYKAGYYRFNQNTTKGKKRKLSKKVETNNL